LLYLVDLVLVGRGDELFDELLDAVLDKDLLVLVGPLFGWACLGPLDADSAPLWLGILSLYPFRPVLAPKFDSKSYKHG
jgi:hypothetical protein